MLRFETWEWQIQIMQVKVEIKKPLSQLVKPSFVRGDSKFEMGDRKYPLDVKEERVKRPTH